MYRHKILSLTLITIFFWSCTKIDTTNIGSGLIPAVDNVNTFDTLIRVVANNYDSSLKDCAIIGASDDRPFGYIGNDPLFGQTEANIYTELKPQSFPFFWPASPNKLTLDSVVLVLSYKGTYGDSTALQNVQVHEILGNFKPDTSTCTFHDWLGLLGTRNYTPQRLKDSAIGFNERAANQLRIKLNNSFGQAFLMQDSLTGSLRNDSAFKAFFKGFAIVPGTAFGNSISFFNLADSNTKLAFYYKYPKPAGGGDTTVVTKFRLTGLTGSASHVRRTRANAEISSNLSQPPAGDNAIYIQTSPGTYANIMIPDLGLVSNRVIHRAELIMDQVYSAAPSEGFFAAPNFLYLDLKDTLRLLPTGHRPIPCDFNTLSGQPDLATFGGFRRLVKDPFGNTIARYTFNISRYVQKIVTNKRASSTLRLRAPADIVVPLLTDGTVMPPDECGQFINPSTFPFPINQPVSGRVKLGGGNNTNYKMRLRLVYSRL